MKEPGNGVPRVRASMIAAAILLAASAVLGGCGSDSISGPQAESCGPGPYFSVLPVTESDLAYVSIFGGVGAPGHTLPTAHGGMFLARENVPFRAPGDIAITLWRVVGGFLIAAALGVPLGLMMGAFKPVEAFFERPVELMRTEPAVYEQLSKLFRLEPSTWS